MPTNLPQWSTVSHRRYYNVPTNLPQWSTVSHRRYYNVPTNLPQWSTVRPSIFKPDNHPPNREGVSIHHIGTRRAAIWILALRTFTAILQYIVK
jgi:hypothetical protein